jgi:hypothetical protein
LPFGNVVVIWHIFPPFGKLCEEKSGNPDLFPGNGARCEHLWCHSCGRANFCSKEDFSPTYQRIHIYILYELVSRPIAFGPK